MAAKELSRMQKINRTRKANIEKRNEWIKKQFKQKYDVERKRLDDCIQEIADSLFITYATVAKVLGV